MRRPLTREKGGYAKTTHGLVLLAALGGLILLAPGCDELVTETIEVTTAGNPTAEFGISPDSAVSLLVSFDDASSGR